MKKLLAVTCAFTLILGAAPVLGSTVLDAPALVVSANGEDPATDLSTVNWVSRRSVTLSGEIGVNFEVTINDPDDFDKIQLFVENSDSYAPKIISKEELTDYNDGGNKYKFTYLIAPMDIDKNICIMFKKNGSSPSLYDPDGNSLGSSYKYSVTDYIDYINNDYFNKNELHFDSETIALVNALKTYGEEAGNYFYDTALPDDHFTVNASSATASKVVAHKFTQTGNFADGVSMIGSSLFIDSKTSYRVYFNNDPGTVMLDGTKQLTVKDEDVGENHYYYFEVQNIAAHELDRQYSVTITKGESSATLTFSAMSYVYSVLSKQENGTEIAGVDINKLAKLARALYAYNFAANMYADKKYSGSTLSNVELTPTENENVYTFSYGGKTYTAEYTPNPANWKIVDSFKITNTKDMLVICEALSRLHPIKGCLTPYRAAADMVDEWVIHNHVYNQALLLERLFSSPITKQIVRDMLSNNYTDEQITGLITLAKKSTSSVDLNTADQGKTENEFMKQYGVG